MLLAVKRLEEWRIKQNMSTYKLAYSLGYSQPYIHNLLSGKRENPSKQFMIKIEEKTNKYVRISDWYEEVKDD